MLFSHPHFSDNFLLQYAQPLHLLLYTCYIHFEWLQNITSLFITMTLVEMSLSKIVVGLSLVPRRSRNYSLFIRNSMIITRMWRQVVLGVLSPLKRLDTRLGRPIKLYIIHKYYPYTRHTGIRGVVEHYYHCKLVCIESLARDTVQYGKVRYGVVCNVALMFVVMS